MHPRLPAIHLRLTASQADLLYYELLGLLEHYRSSRGEVLDDHDEAGLLDAVQQLETGLARSNAVAELQLAHLRAAIHRPVAAAAAVAAET